MSGLSFEKKNKGFSKVKLGESSYKNMARPKKAEISVDKKVISEISTKYNKSTTESTDFSGNESQTELNNQFSEEQALNILNDNNSTLLNKNIPPEFNYFLCNEQYLKKKFQRVINIKKLQEIIS